jgi:hypothetical protein
MMTSKGFTRLSTFIILSRIVMMSATSNDVATNSDEELAVHQPHPVTRDESTSSSPSSKVERKGFGFPRLFHPPNVIAHHLLPLFDYHVLDPQFNVIPSLQNGHLSHHHNFLHHHGVVVPKAIMPTQRTSYPLETNLPSNAHPDFPHLQNLSAKKHEISKNELSLPSTHVGLNGGYAPHNPHVNSGVVVTSNSHSQMNPSKDRRYQGSTREEKRVFVGAILDNLSPSLINRSSQHQQQKKIIARDNQDNRQRDQEVFSTIINSGITRFSTYFPETNYNRTSLTNNNKTITNTTRSPLRQSAFALINNNNNSSENRTNSPELREQLHQTPEEKRGWISFDPSMKQKQENLTSTSRISSSSAGKQQEKDKSLLWPSHLSSSSDDNDTRKKKTSMKSKETDEPEIIRGKKSGSTLIPLEKTLIDRKSKEQEKKEGNWRDEENFSESVCSVSCKSRRPFFIVVTVLCSAVLIVLSLTSLVLMVRFRRKWNHELTLHQQHFGTTLQENTPSFLNRVMSRHGQGILIPCHQRNCFPQEGPFNGNNDTVLRNKCTCSSSSSSSSSSSLFPHQPYSFSSIRFNQNGSNNNRRNHKIINNESHSQRHRDHWFHSRRT